MILIPFRWCALAAVALVAGTSSVHAQLTFGPPVLIDTAGSSGGIRQVLRVADVNGDGYNDVIHLTGTNPAARYYLSTGPAALGPAQNLLGSFDNISDATTGDWNGDGKPDLLVLDKGSNTAFRYQNLGGTYGTPLAVNSPAFTNLQNVVSADFTGDGAEDIIILDHIDALLMKGLGDGTFDTAVSLVPDSLQTEFYHLVKGNFNNDTFPDFAIASSGGLVFLNDGTGQFSLGCTTPGFISFLMEAGDLNSDGLDDLVYKDNVARVLINDAAGTHFTQSQLLQPANPSYRAFDIQDLDGDGDQDLYAVYDQLNRAVWFENTGSGQLDSQHVIYTETGGFLYAGLASDLNGDSRPEPIWSNSNGRIAYHLNQSAASVTDAASKDGTALRLFPNPARDAFAVACPGDGLLTVTDATGRVISRQSLRPGSNVFPVNWPAGLYFCSMSSGATLAAARLVIEHP